jgi:hypothetical protein
MQTALVFSKPQYVPGADLQLDGYRLTFDYFMKDTEPLNHLTPATTLTTPSTGMRIWVARMMFGYCRFHSREEMCRE